MSENDDSIDWSIIVISFVISIIFAILIAVLDKKLANVRKKRVTAQGVSQTESTLNSY